MLLTEDLIHVYSYDFTVIKLMFELYRLGIGTVFMEHGNHFHRSVQSFHIHAPTYSK